MLSSNAEHFAEITRALSHKLCLNDDAKCSIYKQTQTLEQMLHVCSILMFALYTFQIHPCELWTTVSFVLVSCANSRSRLSHARVCSYNANLKFYRRKKKEHTKLLFFMFSWRCFTMWKER